MPSATDRVREALRAFGIEVTVQEFPEGTRTAAQAAAAVRTSVGQIVKSLVFVADGRPLLVLASGANRVDLVKLAQAAGVHAVQRADADTVRRATGFAIGGVPPVGHEKPLSVVIDRDLLTYDLVFAAAGTPHAVFAIAPRRLAEITEATEADIREG
jgi:prolyl-tRNA editing enzyme YbaK/EbsC (Cys-tRNA(Pro) deacylase)